VLKYLHILASFQHNTIPHKQLNKKCKVSNVKNEVGAHQLAIGNPMWFSANQWRIDMKSEPHQNSQ
jgi:hypothetical protein